MSGRLPSAGAVYMLTRIGTLRLLLVDEHLPRIFVGNVPEHDGRVVGLQVHKCAVPAETRRGRVTREQQPVIGTSCLDLKLGCGRTQRKDPVASSSFFPRFCLLFLEAAPEDAREWLRLTLALSRLPRFLRIPRLARSSRLSQDSGTPGRLSQIYVSF